ncbi:MAG: hypothetical protein IIU55_01900 [Paludibacteraceae bacterium]|nr:hypothetical protein [Paludibacteraceae bacterium]
MRRILIIVIGTLLLQGAYAQNAQPPKWIEGYFEEAKHSYVEVVSAVGYEPDNARKKAMQIVIERRSLASGTQATVSMVGNDVQVKSDHDLIAKARVVDEYIEHIEAGQYRVYLLVQTAKNPTLPFDPVTVSEKYPFSARVFVPGMAQLHKGSVGKGATMIAGEVLMIGGIVATECLRQNYAQQITTTHNATLKQYYAQNANICNITRNVCIAGAVACYAWNVIDGIVAKGNKHILIGNIAQLRFAPYATIEDAGLAINCTF